MALGREAEAVDRVGPAVGPLAELVGRLGERHVGGDGAVDNGLWTEKTGSNRHFQTAATRPNSAISGRTQER